MEKSEKYRILNQANNLNDNIEINDYNVNLQNFNECPNCKTKLKSGLLGSNKMFEKKYVDFINFFNENHSEFYCTTCGDKFLQLAKINRDAVKKGLLKYINKMIENIPIITIHNPLNWDYDVIGLVTAQNTTGTGVFFEISTTIDDIFGSSSEKYNNKTKEGENICKLLLRNNAIQIGANAIIGTDIDYTEVGGNKALFMICMAGTAIKIKNPEILGEEFLNTYNNFEKAIVEFKKIEQFNYIQSNSNINQNDILI